MPILLLLSHGHINTGVQFTLEFSQQPYQAFAQNSPTFLTYLNTTYDMSIKYPSDWTKYEGIEYNGMIDIVSFYAPAKSRVDASSAFFIVSMAPAVDIKSLSNYVDELISMNKQSLPTLNLIESISDGSVTLLGKPAYKIVYSYIQDNITYKTMEIGTIIGDKTYFITYDAEESEFSKYEAIAQEMINSFKLSGVAGNNIISTDDKTVINDILPAESTTFANYENTTYGIRMQYPSDWEKQVSSSGVIFSSPLENNNDNFREGVAILIENIQFANGSAISLDNYVKSVISSFEKSGINIAILNQTTTSIGERNNNNNNPALNLIYTWNNGQIETKTMDIYTINGNTLYTITYGAPIDKFDFYLPIVQKMIDSFTFIQNTQ